MTNSPNTASETVKPVSPAVTPAPTPQQTQGDQKSGTEKLGQQQQK